MAELLDNVLHGAVVETPVFESEDVEIAIPDDGRSAALTEWAELISGTSDKKSKAYKAARRNLERWSPSPAARERGAKPRRITVKMRQRLRTVTRRANHFIEELRRGGGEMKVLISWYATRRAEWIPSHYYLLIPEMNDVLDLYENGKIGEAGVILWDRFLMRYNVPNAEDWLENVELLELDLRAA